MSNNSPVYWTANGLSLHTHAWSVKSFGGRRFFGPAKRGTDLLVPFKKGRVYTPKSRESQLFDISMWVVPTRTDGTRDPVLTREQVAHQNWRTIVNAVDVDGQFDLVKRWYEDDTVMVATGHAEYLDGSGPDTDDGRSFFASLTLSMADPYFYTQVAAQPAGTIDVLGDVPTEVVEITFTSGTNPRLTTPDGNWIQFDGTVGTPVVIRSDLGSATVGGVYVNGMISRNPLFPEWIRLTPGSMALTVTGGTATIAYNAAFR